MKCFHQPESVEVANADDEWNSKHCYQVDANCTQAESRGELLLWDFTPHIDRNEPGGRQEEKRALYAAARCHYRYAGYFGSAGQNNDIP